MLSRITVLLSISVVALAACATPQENPYYKYSSKYKGSSSTTVTEAGSVIQTAPVSYETVSYEAAQQPSYTRVNHECLTKEKNHELLGAGIGGTIGAIAGKELIGGTKGTAIGAGLGGVAGYGIGDKAVNCDPQPLPVQQVTTHTQQQSYSPAPTVTASYAAPVIAEPYVSPTDAQFEEISETGTPGYQVLQAQTAGDYDATAYEASAYQAPAATMSAPYSSSGAQEVSYNYADNTISASAETFALPSTSRVLSTGSFASHIVQEGDTVYSLSRKLCVGISEIQSINSLDASYGINIGDTLQLPSANC